MPPSSEIQQLRKGVEEWNRWRAKQKTNPNYRAKFSEIDLHQELSGHAATDISGRIKLDGVDFSDTIFERSNIERISLNDAEFSNSEFRQVSIAECEFRNASFGGTRFWNVLGTRNNFKCAHFTNALIDRSEFDQCKFNASDFRHTKIDRTAFPGCELWKSYIFPANPPKTTIVDPNDDPPPVIEIESVARLTDIRNKLIAKPQFLPFPADADMVWYYRGEASNRWHLRPSVMRDPDDPEVSIRDDRESEMLTRLITAQPEPFDALKSSFDQLVLAQHFKLPTRLLDVTRNPLVGLYKACERLSGDRKSDDGRMHVFAVPRDLRRSFNSDVISVIANFAKLDRAEQDMLLTVHRIGDPSVINDRVNPDIPSDYEYREVVTRLRHFISQEKPYFEDRIDLRDLFKIFLVEPKRSFERLRAQSGAFLISAFHERFEKEQVLKWNADTPIYKYGTIIVPNGQKQCILDELKHLNITEETLMPGLETEAKGIKASYGIS